VIEAFTFLGRWAHFLRLRRKKPGYAGLRFAPAPALRAVAAPHPSYPVRGRKTASMPFVALRSFCYAKTPGKWLQPASCRPSMSFLGMGFSLRENPRNELQPASVPA
jgi:hypothetical protein